MQPRPIYSHPLKLSLILIYFLTVLFSCESSGDEKAIYKDHPPDTFMTRWMVLGGIPVFDGEPDGNDQETQKAAFDDEQLTDYNFDSPAKVEVDGNTYQWQLVESNDDIIDLRDLLADENFVIGYALAEIHLAEPAKALLGIGSDDAVKIWLNGELIHRNWIPRALTKDDDLVPVSFKQGKNHLLLKIQNMEYDWSFACRVLSPASFPEKLIGSARNGDIDGVKMLLEHGADINATVEPGLTALHAAKISGREEVVALLLEGGADGSIPMPSPEALADHFFESRTDEQSAGAAVLISRNGEIIYQKGFGFENIAGQKPVTVETIFRIGSITKQFTASAILKLQADGKLSVEDPVSKYIPDFPRGNEVTIHQLLTHISGIHSYTSEMDFIEEVKDGISQDALIDKIKGFEYDFEPGERWLYNNSGYFMLGYIIEKASGKSFEAYLKENFFDPAGMAHTGVHEKGRELPNEAMGYSYENGAFSPAVDWNMSWAGGAGNLYSTVGDLHKWNAALFSGKLLTEASLKAAFTPVVLKDGSKAQNMMDGYGYGWAVGKFRGAAEVAHGGGLHGFITHLSRFTDKNVTVTVLTNCAPPRDLDPNAAAHAVAEVFLWEELDPQESYATNTALDSEDFSEYAGRYEYPGGAIMEITVDDGRMYAQLTGQPKFEIFPRTATEFS